MAQDLPNPQINTEFSGIDQIKVVSNFADLMKTRFHGEMNAVCWHRALVGNFQEIVENLELKDNITEVTPKDLWALNLSTQGKLARTLILNDLQQLTDAGASPTLNLLKCYERDEELDFIATDVYSYHVDRSPIETDTILCTYYGPASDIISNHQVQQKVSIPEIREKLKQLHDGPASEFEQFLEEYFFDLHYAELPNAQPIHLGLGHLWRLAVDHPTQQALPCVHRAPVEYPDQYRLLLIC